MTDFGVTTMIEVHDRLWSELMGHDDSPAPGQGRPNWRPSMLGFCLRRQYLWRSGVPKTRTSNEAEDAQLQRKFAWGRDLEDHVRERVDRAGLLIQEQVKVEDKDLEVVGHIDFVWGGVVAQLPEHAKFWTPPYRWTVLSIREKVAELLDGSAPITGTEVKSTSKWTLDKLRKQGARFDHRCQAGAYFALALDHPEQFIVPLDRFEILIIGRDDTDALHIEATVADVDLAIDRIDALNDAWHAKAPPPCTCGETEGLEWEAKYCPYGTWHSNECCGKTLLDRLERSVEQTSLAGLGEEA